MKSIEIINEETKIYRTGKIDPVTRIYWDLNREILFNLAIEMTSSRDKILDVGCGVGQYLVRLSEKNRVCYGIDPLWNISLVKARERADADGVTIHLSRACGEALPFYDDMFDEILCTSVLQHVDDPYKTLKEIGRVLKDDGCLLISVPTNRNISTFFLRKRKAENFKTDFDLNYFKDILKDSKFEIRKIYGIGFFPPLTHKMLLAIYHLVGEKTTTRAIKTLGVFARLVPMTASSVIAVCKPQSKWGDY